MRALTPQRGIRIGVKRLREVFRVNEIVGCRRFKRVVGKTALILAAASAASFFDKNSSAGGAFFMSIGVHPRRKHKNSELFQKETSEREKSLLYLAMTRAEAELAFVIRQRDYAAFAQAF